MPIFKRSLCLALGIFSACTEEDPESCIDNFCNDPSLPYCDRTGEVAGEPGRCIAVECVPSSFQQCLEGDVALSCTATGSSYGETPCENGCDPATGCVTAIACEPNTTRCDGSVIVRCDANAVPSTEACEDTCVTDPAPHCSYLEPKFLPDVCDAPAALDSVLIGAFNTNLDAECNGGIVAQTDGPEICVIRAGMITVPAITGGVQITGARALALVADRALLVEGTIDISAQGSISGPGSPTARQSGEVGVPANGKGGAGYVTPGAAGGSSVAGGGGAGGAMVDVSDPAILIGGYKAAQRGGANRTPASGGGGGAATLIACRGTVRVTGTLNSGGGGGRGGNQIQDGTPQGSIVGGAGGGSGGFFALQGLNVSVTGRLYSNGGAGGNGRASTGGTGLDGSDGIQGIVAATAPAVSGDAGRGGSGGTGTQAPTIGGAQTGGTGGGGGGSVGSFVTYVPATAVPGINPIEASPAMSPIRVIGVR